MRGNGSRRCRNCVFWAEIEGNVGACQNLARDSVAEIDLPSVAGGDWRCGHHRYPGEVLRYVGKPDNIRFPKVGGDVGYDLVVSETTVVGPHSFANIPHGVAVGLPDGMWAMIFARSSVNIAGTLVVLPGVIDNGYTGQLFALVHNVSEKATTIARGTRICQLIMFSMAVFPLVYVAQLESTQRGDGGFGSTGGTNGEVHNPNRG